MLRFYTFTDDLENSKSVKRIEIRERAEKPLVRCVSEVIYVFPIFLLFSDFNILNNMNNMNLITKT